MGKLAAWLGKLDGRKVRDPGTSEDLDLVRGTLAGRPQDFAKLVEKHQRGLQRFVELRIGDRAAADEIVQMAFVQAYTRLADFRAEATFKTWVYGVALNLCRDRARAERRRATTTVEEAIDATATQAPRLEDVVLGATVERRVSALPERQRSVLALRIWSDLPFEEIGSLLGISQNSAKVTYHHAIRRLRQWLVEGTR